MNAFDGFWSGCEVEVMEGVSFVSVHNDDSCFLSEFSPDFFANFCCYFVAIVQWQADVSVGEVGTVDAALAAEHQRL